MIDLRHLSSVTDFFVIATASSARQMGAVTEHLEEALRNVGAAVEHVEGMDAAPGEFSWVLIDCGDTVVHLFSPSARTFYQLERLWGDAPRVSLDPNVISAL